LCVGGPLEQGDIEDFDGDLRIVCPWHSFDFDLKTGRSSSGLHVSIKCYKLDFIILLLFL
jgi:nitrite reductase/ring-hydroxylating ferredoxin subunit